MPLSAPPCLDRLIKMKDPAAAVPSLDHFRPVLERLLSG